MGANHRLLPRRGQSARSRTAHRCPREEVIDYRQAALDGLRPWPAAALQPTSGQAPLPRIGVLVFGSAPGGPQPDPVVGGLEEGLREAGLIDGRNVAIEWRYAHGRPERLPMLAAELVHSPVALIVALGPAPVHAARAATSTIPIVAIGSADPVAFGWAQSLARPGGNLTGLTVTFPELGTKHLEILKEARPGIARVAVLLAPAEFLKGSDAAMRAGASALGLELQWLEVNAAADFEPAFERARQGRAQGLYAIDTNLTVAHRCRLAELAQSQRLPSISGYFADGAGTVSCWSYGADLVALGRRSASYIDKILKGAKPGDLPIERPTRFELVVNLGVARALGITLPAATLQRADRVIDQLIPGDGLETPRRGRDSRSPASAPRRRRTRRAHRAQRRGRLLARWFMTMTTMRFVAGNAGCGMGEARMSGLCSRPSARGIRPSRPPAGRWLVLPAWHWASAIRLTRFRGTPAAARAWMMSSPCRRQLPAPSHRAPGTAAWR
ncbi:MAG: ABC transporter substrate-binding protein [Parasphingorhabdus sp.]|nr:ABC transporter substrate-binding protein [Parasphingorhabdus sp.]